MTDRLSLYNGAAFLLKERRFSTVTDDTPMRYHLDVEYDKVIAYCLEQGYWNFARRTVRLEAETDVEPEFGLAYVVSKPDDYVRLITMSTDEYLREPLVEYVDEGAYWSVDHDLVYVSYVSDDTSYGLDMARWPQSFVSFVEHELAYRVGPHATSMSEAEYDRLEKRRNAAAFNSMSKDAQNQPPALNRPGRLVMARRGSRFTG